MSQFIGKFESYTPENPSTHDALHLRNEAGEDWYDIVNNLSFEDGVNYVVTDENGIVLSASPDPSMLFPADAYAYKVAQPISFGMVRQSDGSFVVDMDKIRHQAISTVIKTADQMAEKLTGRVPRAERDSWPLKEAAGRAFQAGEPTPQDTALLQAEAGLTGEDVARLAASVVQKATLFRLAAGKIAGMRRAITTAINEAGTPEQVEAVLADAKSRAGLLLAELQ